MTDDFDFINGVSGRICNLTSCKFKNPAVYFFDALAARGVARRARQRDSNVFQASGKAHTARSTVERTLFHFYNRRSIVFNHVF
ncbi:hypothetical protein [Methylobacter sp.]|uniref:hypothetical protein n=1 Tax=Methylobacter sp. TaxID=2051955 RepID=UPI002FDE372F